MGRDSEPKCNHRRSEVMTIQLPTDEDWRMAWAEYREDMQPNPAHMDREALAFFEGWRSAIEVTKERASL